jgi:polyhydroxyalkanoate synthesis regulator phasin
MLNKIDEKHTHIQELINIDLWLKMGAIDYDQAKEMAKPHINAINEKSKEIAKKHGIKPRLMGFHNFVR